MKVVRADAGERPDPCMPPLPAATGDLVCPPCLLCCAVRTWMPSHLKPEPNNLVVVKDEKVGVRAEAVGLGLGHWLKAIRIVLCWQSWRLQTRRKMAASKPSPKPESESTNCSLKLAGLGLDRKHDPRPNPNRNPHRNPHHSLSTRSWRLWIPTPACPSESVWVGVAGRMGGWVWVGA